MGKFFARKKEIKSIIMIRYLLCSAIALFFIGKINAQAYIDEQQTRIDALDGKIDQFIFLQDLNMRNSATYTYLQLIDEIQETILYNDNIVVEQKVELYKAIEQDLLAVDENKLYQATREEKKYNFLRQFVGEYGQKNSLPLLLKNKDLVFKLLPFLKIFPEMESFFKQLPSNYIDQILYQHKDFAGTPYASSVLEYFIAQAPLIAKRYFTDENDIYKTLFSSESSEMSYILYIHDNLGKNTKAYVFLDKLLSRELDILEADSIGKSKYYFQNLLKIRAKKDPLAEISLDRQVGFEALHFVRKINALHEASNSVRFASLQKLNATELYSLMVYGEDEIFTSSFNGVYAQLIKKMKAEYLSGHQLLEKAGFNKFRMFIKMLSHYGKLNHFLSTMNSLQKQIVLQKFIQGIPHSKHRLHEAVAVADAISAINDTTILQLFEKEFYQIAQQGHLDKDAQLIYHLLIKLFEPKTKIHHHFFDSIAQLYYIPPIEKATQEKLLGADGVNLQKHFFYDDEDGKASFSTFIATFKGKENWDIIEKSEYVIIQSKNKRVKIYANKPQHDENAWRNINESIATQHNEEVELIVHRGHSYYVDYTIKAIPQSAELILLGSCGGYNKLSHLLEKSNNAQIISTKQIGSMGVNNPLLFTMAEKIQAGEDIVWEDYWNELRSYFKNKGKTEEQFYDYVPPHQNLGARLITAYEMYNGINKK